MNLNWERLLSAPGPVRSRSINAENPTGQPGLAARAASPLGTGRKGAAFIPLPAGHTVTLADVEGPGIIRHIWITVAETTHAGPYVLRDLVLRAHWDDETNPAIEVPLGDFFCNGFGARALVTSMPIVVAPTGGMNCYFPMPFHRRAKITLESQHPGDLEHVFYQIDYTVGDRLPDELSRFHAHWRRTNGTAELGCDHVVLGNVAGAGHYVGTYVALTALQRYWWGEGEIKFFIDDDDDHPTQCSTGLEDYAGGAWAFQDALTTEPMPIPITFSAPYFGFPYHSTTDRTQASPFATAMPPSFGLYRWHLPDPVSFSRRLRVTIQQIGAWHHGLFERSDDISTTAYWYQTGQPGTLPPLPSAAERRPR